MPNNETSLIQGQDALDVTRMTKAHPSIVKANVAFGTIVMFRAGSAFDASQVTTVVRKSLKDKDKIAPFGPSIGGIPKNKEFGKRKSDADSLGELYKYVGNYDENCYAQQTLPLCFVLDEFVKGTYELVNPETGISVSYKKRENQTEAEHRHALQDCLSYFKKTKQLCLRLDNVPPEYQPLKKLGYIYKYDLTQGEKSLDPEALKKSTSSTAEKFFADFLPELKDNFTDHYPEDFARSMADAAAGKFEKVEVYAKKVKIGDKMVNVRKSSDEDRLANGIDYESEGSKQLLSLIPDVDEVIETLDPEVGDFGRFVLADEILNLETYIAALKKSDEKTGEKNPLREAFETIYDVFVSGTNGNLSSLYEIIGIVGSTTKREFFWQLYTNVMLHYQSKHYFYTVQHGNENYNPGEPSDIDRVIVQDRQLNKATLVSSEAALVKILLSEEYKNTGMYLNPRWIYDETAVKKEKKESISAYKPKGYLWGAVVQQQLSQGQSVELEILISFYKYVLDLQKENNQINAFLSLHAHGHLPGFEALRKKHLILRDFDCPKNACNFIQRLAKDLPKEIIKKFKTDIEAELQKLNQPLLMTQLALIIHKIERKTAFLKSLKSDENLPAYAAEISSFLRHVEKNMLQFGTSAHFLDASSSSIETSAREYIKKYLPVIQKNCQELTDALLVLEDTEGEGEKMKEKITEKEIILHDDTEGESESIHFQLGSF